MSHAPRQVGLRPSLEPNKTVFDWLPGGGVNPSLTSIQLSGSSGKSTLLRIKDVDHLDDTITTLMRNDPRGNPRDKYDRALETINSHYEWYKPIPTTVEYELPN